MPIKAAKPSYLTKRNETPETSKSPEYALIDSLPSACLLAFAGASLDSFLYLNHGHVFAGVMTGNAVLCGVGVFNKSSGGALHYAWPLLAYVSGIVLVAFAQQRLRHRAVRHTLSFVLFGLLVMSFLPPTFPERPYVFTVVLLTGFLVGISRKVESYGYNATVLTGTLRDATLSIYGALTSGRPGEDLTKGRALWTLMTCFFAGAICGGLLGRQYGNHALWLPATVLGIVLVFVLRKGSDDVGFDEGSRLPLGGFHAE